jgi:diguanylate cyclase (GGDEF)-like protein
VIHALPPLSDEPGRLAALRRYQILDTAEEREFGEVVSLLRRVLGAPMAFVSLIDADRQWLNAAAGGPRGEVPRGLTFCDHTIRAAVPLAVPDASRDPRFDGNPFVLAEGGLRCYLGAPLTTPEGYNVGTVCVAGPEARDFSDAEGEILAGFARLVVSQLEMQMLARRDALTGALTRRAFEEHLRMAAEGAAEKGQPPSLLLIDIDHFKGVNDRFGHPTGDLVLKAVAAAVGGALGPQDCFGRLGGEEFAVLATDRDPGEAAALAQRVRRAIADLAVPALGGHPVTISLGLAPWHTGHADAEGWTLVADIALYAAKRGGRDRVVVAAPERALSAAPG